MDWQFKVGIGVAVVFGLLPFAIRDIPAWITWPGIVAGLALVIWGIIPGHEKIPLGPGLLFIAAISLMAAAVGWYVVIQPSATANAQLPTFFAECHLGVMPTTTGPSNRIFALNVFPIPTDNGGGGFTEFFTSKPSGELGWSNSGEPPVSAWECRITNYGQVAVIDLDIAFHWTFREAIRDKVQPNGYRNGNITIERDWPCKIAKIDPGPANSFVFYVYNMSDKFVDVAMPQSFRGKILGEESIRQFSLTTSDPSSILLTPRWPT